MVIWASYIQTQPQPSYYHVTDVFPNPINKRAFRGYNLGWRIVLLGNKCNAKARILILQIMLIYVRLLICEWLEFMDYYDYVKYLQEAKYNAMNFT